MERFREIHAHATEAAVDAIPRVLSCYTVRDFQVFGDGTGAL
ncbi:MAG TPA: hypothetical protein VNQ14_07880 [Woeseiaceae bacterium]|nr:hypothetical protein [Woeseiaceae bacterium]